MGPRGFKGNKGEGRPGQPGPPGERGKRSAQLTCYSHDTYHSANAKHKAYKIMKLVCLDQANVFSVFL